MTDSSPPPGEDELRDLVAHLTPEDPRLWLRASSHRWRMALEGFDLNRGWCPPSGGQAGHPT